MKKIYLLIILFVVAGKAYSQTQVELFAGVGVTGVDVPTWYGGYVDDWGTMMGEAYVVIYPFHFDKISFGAEIGYQHFFWYTIPVFGYSWVYSYTAYAFRVMALVRANIKDNIYVEVGPGAFLFGDWVNLGAMAAAGYSIEISENLSVPIKIRTELLMDRDASSIVVGLNAGISYTF